MRLPIFFTLFVLVLCGCGNTSNDDLAIASDTAPIANDDSPCVNDDSVVVNVASFMKDSLTFDGYTYKTVKIGNQEWFAENLRTTVYANGDGIPYSRTDESWKIQKMGMRCPYDHDELRSAHYGQLYNGYAVRDERGLCPSGWHVPTDEEWQELEMFLGMSLADAGVTGTRGSGELCIGTKLKARSGWQEGGNGTDDVGFSILPGGLRDSPDFAFTLADTAGFWWSSSVSFWSSKQQSLWHRSIGRKTFINRGEVGPRLGLSVRCIRDQD